MKTKTLGQRLAQLRREKAAREERDIDQTEIAKAIGIGAKRQAYISRWENGYVVPKDDVLKKLADYYGVTPGWLRYGEGDKVPEPTAVLDVVAGPKPRPSRVAASPTKRQRDVR